MSYSGAQTAKTSRENLGKALAALQEDPNIPPDVLAIVQNMAQAMAALFEAEKAPGETEGKTAVKKGLGVIGQTLALLQDVRGQHRGIQLATESIAQCMSALYPLTTAASIRPPAPAQPLAPGMGGAPMMGLPSPGYAPAPVITQQGAPQYAPGVQPASAFGATHPQQPSPAPHPPAQPAQPSFGQPAQPSFGQPSFGQPAQPSFGQPAPAAYTPPPAQPAQPFGAPIAPAAAAFPGTAPPATQAPAYQPPAAQPQQQGAYRQNNKDRVAVEVNIGATTDSNFYVGFSGEISEGGVFCATYNIQPRGTPMRVHVTLPGNFAKDVNGFVRFVRDPMDLTAESEPGMGIQFEGLDPEARELILRFIRKRPPMFYDE
ncbi:MAG: PilZ domain-containing protein [Sandaracinus sp.]